MTAAVKDDKDNPKSNTNKMCRLCLKPATNENLVDIFDSSTEISLTIRIMACAGLEVIHFHTTQRRQFSISNQSNCHVQLYIVHSQVSSQDALPKKICLDCRLQLERSFLFRNKSKNSDAKLRRHFRFINAGKGK